MACPPTRNFTITATANCRSVQAVKQAMVPQFLATAKKYCSTATGNPKCVAIRLTMITWDVEFRKDKPGMCDYTVVVEVNCGEPGKPTWPGPTHIKSPVILEGRDGFSPL